MIMAADNLMNSKQNSGKLQLGCCSGKALYQTWLTILREGIEGSKSTIPGLDKNTKNNFKNLGMKASSIKSFLQTKLSPIKY